MFMLKMLNASTISLNCCPPFEAERLLRAEVEQLDRIEPRGSARLELQRRPADRGRRAGGVDAAVERLPGPLIVVVRLAPSIALKFAEALMSQGKV